jgi:glycosyltransferase involved in cell wall biosynthesis
MSAPTQLPSVAVVVPARNAASTISEQLEALAAQAMDFHLVVVDSQSIDTTVRVAEEYRDRFFRFDIVTAPKAGAATARNCGARATDATLLAFCDADDRVRPQWLTGLVEGLSVADVAYGRAAYHEFNDAVTLRRFDIGPDCSISAPSEGIVKVMGGLSAIRTEVFRRVGGFDERYDGIGNEDGEFYLRVQLAGGTVVNRPDAVVDCRLRGTYRSMWRQSWRNGRGVGLMYRQYGRQARESGIDAPPAHKAMGWSLAHLWWPLCGGTTRRGRWIRATARAGGYVIGATVDIRRRSARQAVTPPASAVSGPPHLRTASDER